ncbi:hypothetical protein CBA19CS22_18010 [Caballeronia novacaledonica]|uniref:Uncharacterized protein n=1 Tax=Caballeronia novacaledonica TaxID=1544861 RepID=A0ACB5QU79_9BURK|nr:hypothetical protein CBA19CS22_18010 [Caballeronia novacaledonica]
MLDAIDQKCVFERGTSTMHNAAFHSLYLGEPMLDNGILSYFDGRVVTICGFSVTGNFPDLRKKIIDQVKSWVTGRSVDGVFYIGPEPVSLRILESHGFRRTEVVRRSPLAWEMCLGDAQGLGTIVERRIYRRAASLPFECVFRKDGSFLAQHFSLIELFYRQRETAGYLAATSVAWISAFRLPDVVLVEAWDGTELLGFVALHKSFRDLAVGLFLATNGRSGVADFLYAKMIEFCLNNGVHAINLDASTSPGQMRFKQKWGAKPLVPPAYCAQWVKGTLSRRNDISWAARLRR